MEKPVNRISPGVELGGFQQSELNNVFMANEYNEDTYVIKK